MRCHAPLWSTDYKRGKQMEGTTIESTAPVERTGRLNLYEDVTQRITQMLEVGTVPWRYPIHTAAGDGRPQNLDSGKFYRGVNVFLLAITAWSKGYDSPYWLTFKQAQGRGGHVKQGEKASMVVFWKMLNTIDQRDKQPIKIPVLRYYNVFNLGQVADVKAPQAKTAAPPFEPISEAKKIIAEYREGPQIEHGGKHAFYSPVQDAVRLPEPQHFLSAEFYYATAFHELAHSTGHITRLNRNLEKRMPCFGSPDYSREELVAEFGSAFLCAAAGISPPTIEQSAAYIAGWRKKLTDDPKLIISAAGAGQRAADRVLGPRHEPPGV